MEYSNLLIPLRHASCNGVDVKVLRLDLLHPELSGNKYFKLKYNIAAAKQQGFKRLISFGGAFSNHIHALAYAAKEAGLEVVGVIRGEPSSESNPTLSDAVAAGMKLHFISRLEYRQRHDKAFQQQLIAQFGSAYIIPEGGSNDLAVKGCTEIASYITQHLGDNFDVIVLPCGTGATLAGIVAGLSSNKHVVGISVLKGAHYLDDDIFSMLTPYTNTDHASWQLLHDYHRNGYAKCDYELAKFINNFTVATQIPVEPIYSAKMFTALFDLIALGKIAPQARVVAIHTGGMQALRGMDKKLQHLLSSNERAATFNSR